MKNTRRIKKFLGSNKREVRFFYLFILFFLLGLIFYHFSSSYTTPFLVYKLHAEMCSKIINILTPDEKTFANNSTVGSGNFTITIDRGCDGKESLLLIIAAFCAFPMGIKQKIYGTLLGILIMYFSNLVRIVLLYYSIKYKPEIFEVMHVYLGQIFIIFIGILFFVIWTEKIARIN
ncbi:MAG TPA: hypothetical protein ENH82_12615 [bacterium]|nr:hypothetical protein [bacterium]